MKKLLLLLFIIFIAGCEIDDTTRYFHFLQKYEGISPSVAFIGDSRIDAMFAPKYFNNEFYNLGHYGYKTSDVINKTFPYITDSKVYDRYIVSIGINDVVYNHTEKSTLDNIEIIINKLLLLSNDIYITGIVSTIYVSTNLTNEKIKALCEKYSITYIDISDMSDDNGLLLNQLSYDGGHYNDDGFKVFTDCVMRYI